jgi:hypothetical protein
MLFGYRRLLEPLHGVLSYPDLIKTPQSKFHVSISSNIYFVTIPKTLDKI